MEAGQFLRAVPQRLNKRDALGPDAMRAALRVGDGHRNKLNTCSKVERFARDVHEQGSPTARGSTDRGMLNVLPNPVVRPEGPIRGNIPSALSQSDTRHFFG